MAEHPNDLSLEIPDKTLREMARGYAVVHGRGMDEGMVARVYRDGYARYRKLQVWISMGKVHEECGIVREKVTTRRYTVRGEVFNLPLDGWPDETTFAKMYLAIEFGGK